MAEERIMKQVAATIQKEVSGLEKVMEGIASQAITSCFQASSKSMGRFSDCIVAAQEKLTKQGERTMAKMQFINMTISQCIRDGKGESACNDEAKELGKKLVQSLNQDLNSILN